MRARPTVLLTIRDLRPCSRPGFVLQDDSWSIVTLDSRATCFEAVDVCVGGLDTDALNVLREAFGEPPVPAPLSDFWMSDCRVDLELIPDDVLTVHARREKDALRRHILGA